MEGCCFFSIETGAIRLTFLSTAGFVVAAVIYTVLAAAYDSASIETKEALLGYFHGSPSVAIAHASVTTTGVVVSALSCWGIYKKQHRWALPFLIFWLLFMLLQLTYVALISIAYGQEMAMDQSDDPSDKQITSDFVVCVGWRTTLILAQVYCFFVLYSYYARAGNVASLNSMNAEKGMPESSDGIGTTADTPL